MFVPGEYGAIPHEKKKAGFDCAVNLEHRAIREQGKALRCRGVDDVSVAAGECAQSVWVRHRPDARRDDGVAKSECASGEEWRLATRTDQDLKRSAFDFFHLHRIDEVSSGKNGGSRRKEFRFPGMGKVEIDRGRRQPVSPKSVIQSRCSSVSGTVQPRATSISSRARSALHPSLMSVDAVTTVERPIHPRQ